MYITVYMLIVNENLTNVDKKCDEKCDTKQDTKSIIFKTQNINYTYQKYINASFDNVDDEECELIIDKIKCNLNENKNTLNMLEDEMNDIDTIINNNDDDKDNDIDMNTDILIEIKNNTINNIMNNIMKNTMINNIMNNITNIQVYKNNFNCKKIDKNNECINIYNNNENKNNNEIGYIEIESVKYQKNDERYEYNVSRYKSNNE